MAPIGSYIWIFSYQGLELFERIRRFRRYGLGGVTMILLEEVCHWGWALKCQKAHTSLWLSHSACWSGCSQLSTSATVPAPMLPAMVIMYWASETVSHPIQCFYFLWVVLVTLLLLWRDTMTKATLIKENIWLRLDYSFRGLVNYHLSSNCGSVQADMVLVRELRILPLDPKAAEAAVCRHN